jgi:hypothetical protein
LRATPPSVADFRKSSALLLALGLACGGEPPAQTLAGGGAQSSVATQELTSAESWTSASPAEDPFVEFEAGRVRCSPFALRQEGSWLEVSTADCNYASLVYRFRADVRAGSTVRGEIAWTTLAATEPAVGTLAFASLPAGVLWSTSVAIPGNPDIVEVEFELGADAPAGSALYFHVRNHGYNTWQLSPLAVSP